MKEVKDPIKSGVVLGIHPETHEVIVDDSRDNVLLIGPTRSGKGISTVIPTALTWKDSAFFFDPLGEIWHLTAGFRKDGLNQKVLKFSPFSKDASTVRWNPLAEVRLLPTDYAFLDISNISTLILSDKNQPETIYSRCILESIIYMLLDRHDKENLPVPSLGTVYDYLFAEDYPIEEILSGIESCPFVPYKEELKKILKCDEEYRESILASIKKSLELFNDPIIRKNTETSDFALKDLLNPNDKISFYFCMGVRNIEQTRLLARLFISQLFRCINDISVDNNEQYNKMPHYLMMLDEFPVCGKIDNMDMFLAYCHEFGVKTCIVCQNVKQLEKLYSAMDSTVYDRDFREQNDVIPFCQLQVYYTPDAYSETETSEFIYKSMLYPIDKSKGMLFDCPKNHFILAREISIMPENILIILKQGQWPVNAHKLRYYKYDFFIEGTKFTPPVRSDNLHEV